MDKALWDHFTGQTGINEPFRDAYDRKTFLLNQSPYQFEPIVSKRLFDNGFRPTYPDGKSFGVCLSHDIDALFLEPKGKLKRSAEALMARQIKASISNAASLSNRKIYPEFHLDNLLEVEQKYKANSSMYFLALEKGEQDFNYDLSEINELFELLKTTGNEIGLHGGHQAYNDLDTLKKEKNRLEKASNQSIKGYRNHFLRFSEAHTWDILASAGFDYDTTFAYPDCVGFRNGMCYPHLPFNQSKNAFIDIVEVPLIVMDVTITRTMRMTVEQGFNFCKTIIKSIKDINGVCTLLWHNSQDDMQDMLLYNKLLEYTHNEGAWLTSTAKMVDWWKENQYIEEVTKGLSQLRNE